MQAGRNIMRALLSPHILFKSSPAAGLKSYKPPVSIEFEYPERKKPRVTIRNPTFPGTRPYRMQKNLRLMRGPELYHNTLLHKQYGIVATGGGRMLAHHFDMIRMTLLRNIDFNTGFVIWRIPDPWQPITRKSQGVRMGSGKGAIDHYATPVKPDQIIIEVGGPFEFFEVKKILTSCAKRLPFAAIPVSQEILDRKAEWKKKLQEENLNPWTWKYIIQNNMLGCHRWISKYDRRWFCEYL